MLRLVARVRKFLAETQTRRRFDAQTFSGKIRRLSAQSETHHPVSCLATLYRIASVSLMFCKISNCAASWLFVDLAAARREGSDQSRIAFRKARRSRACSTIDAWTPYSMISLKTLERVVITGKPQASASSQALENV